MAQSASTSPTTPSIALNHDVEFSAMERILIILLPFGGSTTIIGLVFTNILVVLRSYNYPLSRILTNFDRLFWVERVGCILLWWSPFAREIYGSASWWAAIFILYSSIIIRLHFSNSFFHFNNLPILSTESEMKLKKMMSEIGTEREEDSEQKSVKKEEANERNEEEEEEEEKEEEKKECCAREKMEVRNCHEIMNFMTIKIKGEQCRWREKQSEYVEMIRILEEELEILEKRRLLEMANKLQEKEAMASQFMKRCQQLEQQNLDLHASLQAANQLSHFYKTFMRNFDI